MELNHKTQLALAAVAGAVVTEVAVLTCSALRRKIKAIRAKEVLREHQAQAKREELLKQVKEGLEADRAQAA